MKPSYDPKQLDTVNNNSRNIFLVSVVAAVFIIVIYFKKLQVDFTATSLDVNVTNPSLDVNVINGPLDVNATITNPSLTTSLDKYEDAFGRLRISDQYTIGDYKHVYYDDTGYINSTGNGGSVNYIQNESSVQLVASNTAGSFAVHQTRLYHHYQPGKSQLSKSSFVFGPPVTGITKRTGIFDDNEGIYLEMNGSGVISWNIRSAVTGSPTLQSSISRSNWIDPFDGTGPSGIILNFSQTQLLFIDFQWLGVGRVRCGFVHDGQYYIACQFLHSNNISTPYIKNPSFPIRCEIRGVGGTTGSMKQICATTVSEGGYSETGYDFSINSGFLGRDCDIGGTRYPLLAIRLKTNFKGMQNRVSVRLTNFSVYVENHGIIWELWKLPGVANLTGTVTWNDVNTLQSAVEYSVFPTGMLTTGGAIELISGFTPAGNANAGNGASSIPDPSKAKKVVLTQNFDSTDSEIFVIVAIPIGTGTNFNSNSFASMQWREIY